jgi:hypothetical protein
MRNKKIVPEIIWSSRKIPEPVRDYKITISGKPYIVDYAWPGIKVLVIIEKNFTLRKVKCTNCREVVVKNINGKLYCMRFSSIDSIYNSKLMIKQNDLQTRGWIVLRYRREKIDFVQIRENIMERTLSVDSKTWAVQRIKGLL